MKHSHLQRNLLIILGVAVILLGMARSTGAFEQGTLLREMLAPLQWGVVNVWQKATSPFHYLGRARELSQENNKLKQQVRELTWDNNQLREYYYENKRLLKLLNFQKRYSENFQLLGARVIARSPNNWYQTITIDRGRADGLQPNQPVVADAGLVGQIVSVGPHTSEVLLILDSEGAVGAMVQENRTLGVIEGSREEVGTLRMINLPYDASLKKGQVVISSGLGGIFPRGIPIGKIKSFNLSGGLDKFALVTPFVDFNRLEELFVITGVKKEVPEQTQQPGAGSPTATP